MLLYLPTFASGHPPIPNGGWAATGEPFRLTRTLKAARKTAKAPDGTKGRILVLDGDLVPLTREDPPTARAIPRRAVLNVDPDGDYWRPKPVRAAGGYVVRRAADLEVLMIFRRGVWDLPKGKFDDGETPRQCAVREVAEEVGIAEDSLHVIGDLGPTVHGYIWPKRDVFAIKTTDWFAMTTTAETFEPEEREGIEAVAWVPWAEAAERVGFESLRDHLATIDPDALAV